MKSALFGQSMAIAILLGAASLPLTAHATIDYGNTIESVTTSTYSYTGDYGSSGSSTTAQIDSHAGVIDAKSGLQWIKASSLDEGQALGYRLATVAEFRGLMLDKAWSATAGASDEWSHTAGFSYTTSSSNTYAYSSTSSGNSSSVNNLAPVSFNTDASTSVQGGWGLGRLFLTLGWLDGGAGGNKVGAWFNLENAGYGCSGGRSTYCSSVTQYVRDGVVASLGDLQAGRYDSNSHASGADWSSIARLAAPSSVMYYMVASVPEPSSFTLIGLGLAGMVLARIRVRSRQP